MGMTNEPELMSWHSRFIAALMVLTGAPNEPPDAFIAEWFDKDSTRVDDRLKNWVGGQPGVPWWAQAIAVIDAARIMADQPIEGSPSIDYENEADYAAAATFERARVAEAAKLAFIELHRAVMPGEGESRNRSALQAERAHPVRHLGTHDGNFTADRSKDRPGSVPEEAENVGARIGREWGKVAQERIAQVAAERVRAEDEMLKLDAKRYRFLEKHWHSHMEGLPLHRWVEKTKLRWGGLSNALDHVMKVGE